MYQQSPHTWTTSRAGEWVWIQIGASRPRCRIVIRLENRSPKNIFTVEVILRINLALARIRSKFLERPEAVSRRAQLDRRHVTHEWA